MPRRSFRSSQNVTVTNPLFENAGTGPHSEFDGANPSKAAFDPSHLHFYTLLFPCFFYGLARIASSSHTLNIPTQGDKIRAQLALRQQQ